MGTATESVFTQFYNFLLFLSKNYGSIVLLCCAFIAIDLTTGLTKAKIHHNINSSTGYKGFWRKISLIITLAFGICLDFFMGYIESLGIFPVSFSLPIGLTIGLYITINECISICENLSACGVKMPKFITNALKNTQSNIAADSSNAQSITDKDKGDQ